MPQKSAACASLNGVIVVVWNKRFVSMIEFLVLFLFSFDPNMDHGLVVDVVLQVVHVCCVPFALDIEQQLLKDILR